MTPTNADFEAAGLYDPRAPDAADRLALLDWLVSRGVSLQQMVAAKTATSFPRLAADLAMRPGVRMRLAEVAARAGVPPEFVERVSLASGLPPVAVDEPAFTAGDAEIFAAFRVAAAIFGEPALLHFARVLGSSLARIAEAAVALFVVSVEIPAREAGAPSLTLAQANLRAVECLGVMPQAMEALLRAHLEQASRRQRAVRGPERGDLLALTVGFVDLVGFTPLARQLSAAELGTLVEDFEALANDVTAARDARLVKHLGDAVMFVAAEPRVACDIALTLVEHFADDPVVRPHGGLASGSVLMRSGDYYGPVVNLASRIAELAVPREILVSREVAEHAAGTAFRFEPAGKRMLKGVDEPQAVYAIARGR
jgi:adenylate cyclase